MRWFTVLLLFAFSLPEEAQTSNIPDMIKIKADCFTMGSEEFVVEEPEHKVCLNSYYLMVHKVTQKQFESVTGENPSRFKGLDLPVENVSWPEADTYCRSFRGRLPTEAEWERACRGTEGSAYSYGQDYDVERGRSGQKLKDGPVVVNAFAPGNENVFAMTGNVWEWCHNAYAPYRGSDMVMEDGFRVINGGHATNNIVKDNRVLFRVFRGGSWMVPSTLIRPANREKRNADYAFDNIGFRLMKKVN
jgi:formylglycine-generating enzyme required for sulfatase activity